MKNNLVIPRNQCYYPGCKKPAEQWHHVWPRCVTKQEPKDYRGSVPACLAHHALATAESTLIKAATVRWESTQAGRKQLSRLIAGYKAGQTQIELGNSFNLNPAHVGNILRRNGVVMRTPGCSRRRFKPVEDRRIRTEYENGTSTVALGDKYGCDSGCIARAIQRAGGTIRNMPEARKLFAGKRCVFDENQKIALYSQYKTGAMLTELAKNNKVDAGTISRAIKSIGGRIRSISESKKLHHKLKSSP